ncbi:hypothetical protein PINS_up002501 [Pythium insidiosum]|nr:hypothetical protein PINS_up002501 [Pythium insidiosum]
MDPSAPFEYSQSLMPGVHFYTFLASKASDAASDAKRVVVPQSPVPGATLSPRGGGVSSFGAGVVVDPADANDVSASAHPSVAKRSHGLRMWVPDTIVYGETGRAVWLYSDDDGYVQRMTEFTDKMILDKFTSLASAGNAGGVVGDNEPVVVCKEPIVTNAKRSNAGQEQVVEGVFSYQGNLLRLLSLSELRTLLNNVSSTRGSRSFALQRFVRCKGSKAFIVRAVYEVRKPHYAWMVSNVIPYARPHPDGLPSASVARSGSEWFLCIGNLQHRHSIEQYRLRYQ